MPPTALKPTSASVDRIRDAEPSKPPMPLMETGRAPHPARDVVSERDVCDGQPTASAGAPLCSSSTSVPIWQAQLQKEADAGAAPVLVNIDWGLAATGSPRSVSVLPICTAAAPPAPASHTVGRLNLDAQRSRSEMSGKPSVGAASKPECGLPAKSKSAILPVWQAQLYKNAEVGGRVCAMVHIGCDDDDDDAARAPLGTPKVSARVLICS